MPSAMAPRSPTRARPHGAAPTTRPICQCSDGLGAIAYQPVPFAELWSLTELTEFAYYEDKSADSSYQTCARRAVFYLSSEYEVTVEYW
jgi:hypothetical protein